MLRSFISRALALVTTFVALGAFGSINAWGQAVTVVEYYNKSLDAYFITGRSADKAALDGIADYQRTGMSFEATTAATAPAALTKICRFYIHTATPYTSSHFYGRQGIDCESIRGQNLAGFDWEDYDFAVQQPVATVCPSGTTTVYRSFRVAANGKTSNHRYSASLADYTAASGKGYAGEGAAFCAGAATAVAVIVTPPVSGSGECGDFYTSSKKITLKNLAAQAGIATTFIRTFDSTPVSFRGKMTRRVIDTSSDGTVYEIFLEDLGTTYAEIGSRTRSGASLVEVYWTPPIVYPKVAAAGNTINYTRAINTLPVTAGSEGTQTGVITLIGRESVTVPAGTFNACKYTVDAIDERPTVGARVVTTSKTWFMPNVGIIRFESNSRTTAFGASFDGNTELVATAIE
jgi:hypothetical protein